MVIILKHFREEAVSKNKSGDMLPLHWPKEVSLAGGRIDLERETKRSIKIKFKASSVENVKVIDVDEICNAEFYQRYERYIYHLVIFLIGDIKKFQYFNLIAFYYNSKKRQLSSL